MSEVIARPANGATKALAPHKAAPSTASVAADRTASNSTATGDERTAATTPGYTHAQLKAVLEFVAGTAHTLNNILMMAQTCEEQWECSRLVDAAQALAQHIGSAADMATGNMVIGDFARWNYGPIFADLGKAGAA